MNPKITQLAKNKLSTSFDQPSFNLQAPDLMSEQKDPLDVPLNNNQSKDVVKETVDSTDLKPQEQLKTDLTEDMVGEGLVNKLKRYGTEFIKGMGDAKLGQSDLGAYKPTQLSQLSIPRVDDTMEGLRRQVLSNIVSRGRR